MRPKLLASAVVLAGATFAAFGALAPSRPNGTSVAEARPVDQARFGLDLVRRSRDDADPSALALAETALRRSLREQPRDNLDAFVGMAALANARHDFSRSVRWSRLAIETNPHNAAAYGLLGDALFELGRVRAADAAYQKMLDTRPDVASYVRASYAYQHHGRPRAATGALRLALQAAGPTGETTAFVRHQLGDVYAGIGDMTEAARQNRLGAAVAPGYVPPTVGLAEAYVAQGRLQDAIALMEPAVRRLPSVEYLITLGDLYLATGERGRAAEQYAGAAAGLADLRANGVLPDADFVVFYADHGLRPRATLREARAIYANRPTPKIADALAWALHANGHDRAAWKRAREATAVKAPDATALFHAASIAKSLGRDERAAKLARRALDADPAFSLVQAPIARRYASGHGRGLRGGGGRAAAAIAAR